MPVKVVDWYTEELLAEHPDWYFVFGDNDMREGTGDQAKPCECSILPKPKIPCYHREAIYIMDEIGCIIGSRCSRCDNENK